MKSGISKILMIFALMKELILFYIAFAGLLYLVNLSPLGIYLHPKVTFIYVFLAFQSYLTFIIAQIGLKDGKEKFTQSIEIGVQFGGGAVLGVFWKTQVVYTFRGFTLRGLRRRRVYTCGEFTLRGLRLKPVYTFSGFMPKASLHLRWVYYVGIAFWPLVVNL